MRMEKNGGGWRLGYNRQERLLLDRHVPLVEIDLTRRPDKGLILGSLESL